MNRLRRTFSFLFGAWRMRPLARKGLWTLSIILALSGTAMLSYPFATDFISERHQSRLAREFKSPEFRTQFGSRDIEPGHVVMRIVIPSIDVDALVVEGTDARSLRAGAGRYRSTALPCRRGNVAIAGHRNIYGEPFARLDELKVGDEISLITPDESCTYEVTGGPKGFKRPRTVSAGWITEPTDSSVIGPLSGRMLTLTTCHPRNSASKRLIVRAKFAASV